jgi:hypothetical protein
MRVIASKQGEPWRPTVKAPVKEVDFGSYTLKLPTQTEEWWLGNPSDIERGVAKYQADRQRMEELQKRRYNEAKAERMYKAYGGERNLTPVDPARPHWTLDFYGLETWLDEQKGQMRERRKACDFFMIGDYVTPNKDILMGTALTNQGFKVSAVYTVTSVSDRFIYISNGPGAIPIEFHPTWFTLCDARGKTVEATPKTGWL